MIDASIHDACALTTEAVGGELADCGHYTITTDENRLWRLSGA